LAEAELSDSDHGWLVEACASRGLRFLTTVFTASRVPFLEGLGLSHIKIGSGEAMNPALLDAVAAHPWTVYLSTGLCTRLDLAAALTTLRGHRVILMHTVSEYPTPVAHVNLTRLEWLRRQFTGSVGYSDHTVGLDAAKAAMVCDVSCVEVHLRGKRRQAWDKSPGDLRELTRWRDAVAAMDTPRQMAWLESDTRPFLGRWQYGG
jgi:sialic acid synthase SpsE